MNKHMFLKAATGVAFLLSASTALKAETIPVSEDTRATAAMLRDKALESETAYTILESLTTEVGPRLGGSEKEAEAARWAVAKLKALGFDKVYMEPVTVAKWERLSESASVVAPYTQPLHITALGKSAATPEGGVTAEIVHIPTYEALLEADAADIEGKIVFISNRMERFKTGAGYGPAVQARGKGASEAARKGAKAIIIRSIGTDSHRLPHTGGVNYDADAPRIAAAALSNPDADLLERMLERGKPISIHLDVQTKEHGDVTMHNVIGEITGREKPDEVVLMGSHLDSWDLGTGAIDDGAGVAITVAAADMIQNLTKERPRRTLRVVLFASEELGLIGAKQYADAHKDDVANHAIGAESDFGAGPVWALASNVSTDSLHVVDTMAQLMQPLGVVRHGRKAGGGPDVGQMVKLGMPGMDLMQDGTDYFDLHHTADDTLDKVDPAALKQNLAAWVVFAYIAAEWPGDFR
ncbi:M28 family peptidase [Kordiimonas lipolytica]|uniref:Carboxypeptidase Q n=1 Tax=Kordiimonas lipolytica TaxID=1662421 RepID=A0ABV8UAX8_9PROT|nr:M28 family peptidase [Kordiimonas lipolytica]